MQSPRARTAQPPHPATLFFLTSGKQSGGVRMSVLRSAIVLALSALVLVAHASASGTCNCARCSSGLVLPAHNALDSTEVSTTTTKSTPSVQWYGGTFTWPCVSTKNIYKQSKRYISRNVIGTRFQIVGNHAIIAMPRLRSGVPSTLVRVDLKHRGCQAELEPYPCWAIQEEGNPQSLQSVVDLFLDHNALLWVLDVGIVNTLEQPVRRASPKVVAIDTRTGKVVKSVDLSSLVCEASRLQYLVVDYASDGRVFLYVSDAAASSIIVYDVSSSKGYRLMLPKAVTQGCGRTDVLYLTLARSNCGTNNVLFFTYLSSQRLFSIKTVFLQKGVTSGRVHDHGVKPAKLIPLGTDGGSIIFFRYEGLNEIYSWDSNTCFKVDNFNLVYRSPSCLFATHVAPDLKIQRLRVLESNFPEFIQDRVGCGAYQVINVLEGNCL